MTLTQITNRIASWTGRQPHGSSFKPKPSPYTSSNLQYLASYSSPSTSLEEEHRPPPEPWSPPGIAAHEREEDPMSHNNFVERPPAPPPRPKKVGGSRSIRSRANSIDTRLSIIAEDAVPPPPLPERTHNRFFNRRWNIGEPPRHSFEGPPPKYSVWDATGPKGEKLADVRNNKYIARRGGWRRLLIIGFIFVAITVALVVGLVIGLRKKNSSNSPPPPSSSSNSSSDATAPFPAGSYTFTTFLSALSTNCTSNPADWTCAPGHTYQESPSEALANFTWIIAASLWDITTDFTISSSDNPFAFTFANASLALKDPNSAMERYTFSTSVDTFTVPQLGVHCFYNNTILEASLYTRRSKTYPAAGSSSSSAPAPSSTAAAVSSGAFPSWQFAVEITQHIAGGPDVPACYQMHNGQQGARITDGLAPQAASSRCSCGYKNF